MEPRPIPMIDRHFIYFPVRELFADPAAIGLAYEEVNFVAGDGVSLHGWFVPGRSDLTLLWCHGNGGNISHRLENLLLVHNELGLNVFLFDYRGYGRSDGKPSEQGTYLDAEAALTIWTRGKTSCPIGSSTSAAPWEAEWPSSWRCCAVPTD